MGHSSEGKWTMVTDIVGILDSLNPITNNLAIHDNLIAKQKDVCLPGAAKEQTLRDQVEGTWGASVCPHRLGLFLSEGP